MYPKPGSSLKTKAFCAFCLGAGSHRWFALGGSGMEAFCVGCWVVVFVVVVVVLGREARGADVDLLLPINQIISPRLYRTVLLLKDEECIV